LFAFTFVDDAGNETRVEDSEQIKTETITKNPAERYRISSLTITQQYFWNIYYSEYVLPFSGSTSV